MNNNDVYFIGGFNGTSKSSGKPFYCLCFGLAQEQKDNKFGGTCANVFVDDKQYNDFKIKAKPWTYVKANVLYVRGGYTLINYTL